MAEVKAKNAGVVTTDAIVGKTHAKRMPEWFPRPAELIVSLATTCALVGAMIALAEHETSIEKNKVAVVRACDSIRVLRAGARNTADRGTNEKAATCTTDRRVSEPRFR